MPDEPGDERSMPPVTLRPVEGGSGVPTFSATAIEEILNRPDLSPEERHAGLTDLAGRLGEHSRSRGDDPEGDDQYAPLLVQIESALAMLAGGGHSYDGVSFAERDLAEAAELEAGNAAPFDDAAR